MSQRLFLLHLETIPGLLCLFLACQDLHAQTNYQRIFSFGPTAVDGSAPRGSLLLGSDGLLYGATSGGSNSWGSIYSIAPDGTSFRSMHSFQSPTLLPVTGLVEASDGFLYGTVASGGSLNAGVVYRIARDGSGYTLVHQFDAPSDGRSPVAGLLSASDGCLYGTAASGGSNNLGIVFRIVPGTSSYSILHHFSGADGSNPSARLIEGADGSLYGTARKGGIANLGVVFRLRKDGIGGAVVLRDFRGVGQMDGKEPLSGLAQSPDGMLYGTTYFGGSADFGSIFKLNTNGTGYSVIWHCQYATTNGIQPSSGLVHGGNGVLYGTMPAGGQTYGGIAFAVGTNGNDFTILRSFTGANGDGLEPYAPLLRMPNGECYGTTFSGGDYPSSTVKGVIFRLTSLPAAGSLRLAGLSAAEVLLDFTGGSAGRSYTIQRSSTLAPGSWSSIGSRTANIAGSFSFSDTDAPLPSRQWYRTALE